MNIFLNAKGDGAVCSPIFVRMSRPSIFLQTLLSLCLILDIPRVLSFVTSSFPEWKSNPHQDIKTGQTCFVEMHLPPSFGHRSPTPGLQLVADKASGCSQSGTNGFFWDFQGHSCYAEVAQPSNANKDEDREKPVLVLIHGFACSTVYWRETRDYLTEAGYAVHLVDLLGQGKSAKPGRSDNIVYSIDLWAKMVDEYALRYIGVGDDKNTRDSGVVLVGNSLGSVVALSAATGDCHNIDMNPNDAHLPSRVKGLCFFNCGVGMNTQNALKEVSSEWFKSILALFFKVINFLVFNNKALLTYVIDNQVSKDSIRTALTNLYSFAEDPQSRVDDELVNSFIDPVLNDSTPAVVEVLSQIYTNDAGRTPMELHNDYFSTKHNKIPIHLIWGDKDPIAPVTGPVGQFYSKLSSTSNSGVTMQVIKDAGHIPFDERPECNAGLIEWLENKL